jgi:type I restriction enzyme R subunit
LDHVNSLISSEALDDAFLKLTRAADPDLVFRDRAMHRMLVDGINVEFKRKDGSAGGAQVDALLS